MKKTYSGRTRLSAGTRALLGAVSTLAIALGVAVEGAAANEQFQTAASARDGARSAGILIASRMKSGSVQRKMEVFELKTQSSQHKMQGRYMKLESGRFKTESRHAKFESHQHKLHP